MFGDEWGANSDPPFRHNLLWNRVSKMEETIFDDRAGAEAVIEEYFLKNLRHEEDSSLKETLSQYHVFERIAAMKNAENNTDKLMSAVYESEDKFLKNHHGPQGYLTKAQLKEIEDFWRPYSFAYKNNPEMQQYYSLVSGRFDPSYISFGLHYHLLKRFWDSFKRPFIQDSDSYEILFPEVKLADVVFLRVGGTYYDASKTVVTKEKAAQACVEALAREVGAVLTLRTVSDGGESGALFFKEDITTEKFIERLDSLGAGDLSCRFLPGFHHTWLQGDCGNPGTARVMTMVLDGKPEIMSSYLRMSIVDADKRLKRFGIRVSDDGILDGRAVEIDKGKWWDEFSNGEMFAGRKLFNYQKVKDTVLTMAQRVVELKAISWDVAVDTDGNVLLLDLIPGGGVDEYQVYGDHLYGGKKKMKEILDEYLIKKFYYECADWEWNYWEFKNSVTICKYAGLKKMIRVPEKLRGKPVTAIRARAFEGKTIEKIIIPECVKLISPEAFTGCGKDCDIIVPKLPEIYKKIYRVLKSHPYCEKTADFLKDYWMEVKVDKTTSILNFIKKRLTNWR